jgi:hypothetical protein
VYNGIKRGSRPTPRSANTAAVPGSAPGSLRMQGGNGSINMEMVSIEEGGKGEGHGVRDHVEVRLASAWRKMGGVVDRHRIT